MQNDNKEQKMLLVKFIHQRLYIRIYLISTIVFLESQLRDLQKEVSSSETPTSNNFLKRRSNTVTPEERNGDHVTPFKPASYTVPP